MAIRPPRGEVGGLWRVAKADLVPTRGEPAAAYGNFVELEAVCAAFGEQVNAQPPRVTRRTPAEMLGQERSRLHPLPAAPFTTPMVAFECGEYSVASAHFTARKTAPQDIEKLARSEGDARPRQPHGPVASA